MLKVLIVEDKKSMASMLKETLEGEGYAALVASNGDKGLSLIKEESPDLVLTDLKLPGKDGMAVLKASKENNSLRPVILMTAHGTIDTAIEAMKEGVFDFITKPFNIDHLLLKIKMAFENQRLVRENILLKDTLSSTIGLPDIIGKSESIRAVGESIRKAAPQKTTILLLGESGTGKELFARAIHYLSDRRDESFVPINCAAIPKDLLESELFGHEKGAFTGAEKRKFGKFELANMGTVFLDEISEMSSSLQAKLLRVLQEGEVDRVGSAEAVKIDVRVVAATNANLEEKVADGTFRDDLYYRLNVFPVVIPPLRERKDDIPLLAEHFLHKYASTMNSAVSRFTPEALKMLKDARWRGNVRELENTIERAIILSEGDTIEHGDISPGNTPGPQPVNYAVSGSSEGQALEQIAKNAQRVAETKEIKRVLAITGGNKSKAAEILKVSYKTLLTKIKDYEIS